MPVVISPFVGIALGIPGLLNLTVQLLDKWKEFYRSMKSTELDGELLFTRFDYLTQQHSSLQAVLFKEDKFYFITGRVFDHLTPDRQNVLQDMFRELARLLYTFMILNQNRNISVVKAPSKNLLDVTLSPEQIAELFADTEFVPSHGNPKLRLSRRNIAWASSNKKHVENFVNQYEAWLKMIRETMEDFWWPLSFFEKFSNVQALESDTDCLQSGIVEHSRLRKLLLEDSLFKPTLELKDPGRNLENERDTSWPLRKLAQLDKQDVLIETMPYKVDTSGFMPAELRRRFCTIAALLNVQGVDELRVLQCLYWKEVRVFDGSVSRSSFQLISALPAGLPKHFVTMEELLVLRRGNQKPSLECRLDMAHCLAQTLSECLKIGWRHRSVRAGNIIHFLEHAATASSQDLEKPFLCGFEESRLQDDYSMNSHGDNSIKSNVYRHPQRWGTPKAEFNAYHDLYGPYSLSSILSQPD